MSNVKRLKTNPPEESGLNLFGVPICCVCEGRGTWHTVVVEGLQIPDMLVREWEDNIEVKVDRRFVYVFDNLRDANHAVNMAATCYAIGSGYSHIGAKEKGRPFAPKVVDIGGGDE